MKTSKPSSSAPAEAGIEISSHDGGAAGDSPAFPSVDRGEQRGAASGWLDMDFLSAN